LTTFYQGLARLLKDKKNIAEAKENVKQAISFAEVTKARNLFTCHDTYGQIYKSELQEVKKNLYKSETGYNVTDLLRPIGDHEESAMELALLGSQRFNRAVEIFRNEGKTNSAKVTYDQVFIGDFSAMLGDIQILIAAIQLVADLNLFEHRRDLFETMLLNALRLKLPPSWIWEVENTSEEDENPSDEVAKEEAMSASSHDTEKRSLQKMWDDYGLSSIYDRIRDHLVEAVRRVTTNKSLSLQIERCCHDFDGISGESILEEDLNKLIKSPIHKHEKFKKLKLKLIGIETPNANGS